VFKRVTGVKREVFGQMVECVRQHRQSQRKHPSRGVRAKLEVADEVLLLYDREYRTQLHISLTYGLSESRVCELIKQIESVLLADKRFHLPGKKALLGQPSYAVVLVDATETPVERPQKNNADITLAKRSGTRTKRRSWPSDKAAGSAAQPARTAGGMTSDCSRTAK
jgi:hypothetical protein